MNMQTVLFKNLKKVMRIYLYLGTVYDRELILFKYNPD
jgi:hypothetical protein